jgi:ribose transport system ATP-binding protein
VKLLILDEPTASLPGPEVDRLFASLRRVAKAGTAILFISHHLDEVLGLADRVTVLRDGTRVASENVKALSQANLVGLILGRELTQAPRTRVPAAGGRAVQRLEVRHATGQSALDVSFTVSQGEILGIAGLTGSGREEVAGLLSGQRARVGTVTVDEVVVASGSPRSALDAGLCFVAAERFSMSLLHNASIRENLTIGNLAPVTRLGKMSRKLERAETERWIEELDIRPPDGERQINELSGGNQQKVVIGRWLRVEPKVLVLDEPTQGVDVGAKALIHELILKAARRDAAVVVCSTDTDELARVASRVLVMRRNGLPTFLEGDDVTVERIEHEQLIAGDEEIR